MLFADDQALAAHSELQLQTMMDNLNRVRFVFNLIMSQ